MTKTIIDLLAFTKCRGIGKKCKELDTEIIKTVIERVIGTNEIILGSKTQERKYRETLVKCIENALYNGIVPYDEKDIRNLINVIKQGIKTNRKYYNECENIIKGDRHRNEYMELCSSIIDEFRRCDVECAIVCSGTVLRVEDLYSLIARAVQSSPRINKLNDKIYLISKR